MCVSSITTKKMLIPNTDNNQYLVFIIQGFFPRILTEMIRNKRQFNSLLLSPDNIL